MALRISANGAQDYTSGMQVHLLGTAQDGGVPHPGCDCRRCGAARTDPALARMASCLAVQAAEGAPAVLLDCTPDFPRQSALLKARTGSAVPAAILLTHAHLGHYLGLAFLGREALSAKALPVHCTDAMGAFLQANKPFRHLLDRGEIVLKEAGLEMPGLKATSFQVPHRNEDADTVGWRLESGGRRVLFIPDFDAYTPRMMEEIAAADLAFLDGTFWADGELKGRDQKSLGHPPVKEAMEILKDHAAKVRFLHLNHSNPLLEDGPERAELRALGFGLAAEGETVRIQRP